MIEINWRDDGDNRLRGVGRVESAAHSGFENNQFGFAFSEMEQCKRGYDFKKSGMRIPIGDEICEYLLGHARRYPQKSVLH